MKMVNPFDRLKKKEFTPMSLFPASKRVRTSMPLGRAVPIYFNPMVQGNKISLSAAELSRFASLNVPIMNEFEVSLGAYFVPYVSFDEFFDTPQINKFCQDHSTAAANIMKVKLNARNFFNPAADDSTRIHPISLPASFLNGIELVGSLFDHLGYYIGQNEDLNDFQIAYWSSDESGWSYDADDQAADVVSKLVSGDHLSLTSAGADYYYLSAAKQYATNGVNDVTAQLIFGPDLYAYLIYRFGKVDISRPLAASREWFQTIYNSGPVDQKVVIDHIVYWLTGNYSGTPFLEWEDVFGKLTQASFWKAYTSYVDSVVRFTNCQNFEANVIRALTYYRIYADWFLDDNFIKRDEFLTIIGTAYLNAAVSGSNLIESFTTRQDIISTDSTARIFLDDLAYGKCLPVMAEKNYFTAARQSETYAGFGDFKYQNGGVETPVGETIHEHFFNRAYQRFKDFITRMGYDFRDNAAALYGHRTSDESLLRSQIFGSYDFDVKVGDIAQTSETTSSSELGSFAGMAISKNGTGKFEFTANEPGAVMILAWIRPKNTAIAGTMGRDMFKSNYNDYLLPTFGGVGMQDIYMNEIYPCGANSKTDKFGVTEIYSEYMSVLNECSGLMRTTQSYWNSDRILKSKPLALDNKEGAKLLYYNDDWYDDMNRIFMDQVNDPILCTWYINGSVTRQLPEVIRTDF